jgi:hypothetical protein
MNRSASQIDDVWVEGRGDAWIKLFQVPACTLYMLPAGFLPLAVNFRDPYGRWRVTETSLATPNGKPFPGPRDSGDPGPDLPMEGCS